MRILSLLLFLLAGAVAGCAILAYAFLTNLACGYAPGASGCHAMPWELGDDDRFWLVGVPMGTITLLIALALLARRSARRGSGKDAR